jgi:hypothetical protein
MVLSRAEGGDPTVSRKEQKVRMWDLGLGRLEFKSWLLRKLNTFEYTMSLICKINKYNLFLY